MSAQWGEASIPVPVDPGGEMFDPLGGAPGFMAGFGVIFVVVMIAVAVVFVISIITAVRKYRVLKDAGVDPLTVDAAIAAKVLRSGALAEQAPASPPPSTEQRLAELDDLRARGVISEEEHRAARAAALGT